MNGSHNRAANACNIIIEACLIAILVFTPLAHGATRPIALIPAQLLILAMFCAWLVRMNAEDNFSFRHTPLNLPIILFLTLSVVSLFHAPYRHDALMTLCRIASYCALYFVFVNNMDSRRKLTRILAVLITMGALLSIIGIVLYLGHRFYGYWLPGNSVSATYMNRDHFAGYLEMVMPLSLGLLFTRISREKKALVLFLVLVMALAFVLAASRGAWLSFSVSCLVLLPLFSRKKLLKSVVIGSIICGIILYFALAQFDLGLVMKRVATIAEGGAGVDQGRILMWQGAVGLIKAHPFFGSGLGMFIHAFPQYRPAAINPSYLIDYAHNDYLHMAAELGLGGLLIILWVVGAALWSGFREFYLTQSTFKRGISAGASIGIMSMALHSLVDFNLHIPANAIVFIVLLGLSASTPQETHP